MNINVKIFIVIAGFLFFPFIAKASTLYFDPVEAQYGFGDTFAVNVKLDIGGQCVNTVEANIIFPKDILRYQDFSVGQSILSLWIDNPSGKDSVKINEDGRLHFSGGIPGGYCGKIQGDPGTSNIVGKIIFNVLSLASNENEKKEAKIDFLPETSVLLNDGLGTKDNLATQPATITISGKETFVKNNWQSEVKSDQIQPEPFIIELQHDPNKEMFKGDYYIIYNTTDKQTGVDHYEVLEILPNTIIGEEPKQSYWEKIIGKKLSAPNWKRAESPYLLEDQNLKSLIKVRAIDKAGNERIVEYIPTNEQKQIQNKKYIKFAYYSSLLIITLVLLAILRSIYKKLRRRNQ